MGSTRSRFGFRRLDIVIVAGAFVVVVGVALGFFLPDILRVRGWESTEGTVTAVDRNEGEVAVSYFFRADGETYLATDEVNESALDGYQGGRLEPGDNIGVRLPPGRPRLAVSELTTRGSIGLLVATVAGAAAIAILALVLIGRFRRRDEVSSRRSVRSAGLLRCQDGKAMLGGFAPRGRRFVLDANGITVRGRGRREVLTWDAIERAETRVGRGLKGLFVSQELVVHHDGEDTRLALRPQPGRPIPNEADLALIRAVIEFCAAYRQARWGLSDPRAVAEFVDEAQRVVQGTRPVQAPGHRWPEATPEARRELDETMGELVRASGVELFGGRAVRGHRLEPDAEVVSAAREWLPTGVKDLSPSDDVIVAAIETAQGPRPSWPLDHLLSHDADSATYLPS